MRGKSPMHACTCVCYEEAIRASARSFCESPPFAFVSSFFFIFFHFKNEIVFFRFLPLSPFSPFSVVFSPVFPIFPLSPPFFLNRETMRGKGKRCEKMGKWENVIV